MPTLTLFSAVDLFIAKERRIVANLSYIAAVHRCSSFQFVRIYLLHAMCTVHLPVVLDSANAVLTGVRIFTAEGLIHQKSGLFFV